MVIDFKCNFTLCGSSAIVLEISKLNLKADLNLIYSNISSLFTILKIDLENIIFNEVEAKSKGLKVYGAKRLLARLNSLCKYFEEELNIHLKAKRNYNNWIFERNFKAEDNSIEIYFVECNGP